MAKPIVKTPALTGAEAKRFLEMHSDMTLKKEDEEIFKHCVETYRKHKK